VLDVAIRIVPSVLLDSSLTGLVVRCIANAHDIVRFSCGVVLGTWVQVYWIGHTVEAETVKEIPGPGHGCYDHTLVEVGARPKWRVQLFAIDLCREIEFPIAYETRQFFNQRVDGSFRALLIIAKQADGTETNLL